MKIQYIYVNNKQYLSREFEYTDKHGQGHCCVVADETILEVIEEGSSVDIGIYGYVSIQFLLETLLLGDQDFAQKLNELIDMEL